MPSRDTLPEGPCASGVCGGGSEHKLYIGLRCIVDPYHNGILFHL